MAHEYDSDDDNEGKGGDYEEDDADSYEDDFSDWGEALGDEKDANGHKLRISDYPITNVVSNTQTKPSQVPNLDLSTSQPN